ncbi:DUF1080 domain-containing protein [Parabacteroides sp. OttesenSCG-928-B22]|nr:DUF1080 domain-containing protein [Parabacteroides sp. OttesenSCG-928-B22]
MSKKSIKHTIVFMLACLFSAVQAQDVSIHVQSEKVDGLIDQKIYGQLFEHIYFSANNGLWQELIYGRSFEPQHYPGIPPRDGYFDGWFVDDANVLHSPTRYEQPIPVTTINSDNYEISMDVNWRAYKLAGRRWSGGLLDIRFAFKNQMNGEPYFLRIHDPFIETRNMREGAPEPKPANFSISTFSEMEIGAQEGMPGWTGQRRVVKALQPLKTTIAKKEQITLGGEWHKLRIRCEGKRVRVYWDNKQIINYQLPDNNSTNEIAFWVNYTEALYKDIRITSTDKKTVYFEGMPEAVKTPEVAPQWQSFGNGTFELVKNDAVNMDYSQKITASGSKTGLIQGPQNIIRQESYVGSVYAKGDSKSELFVALKAGDRYLVEKMIGKPGKDWTKYEFSLNAGDYVGDADFAIYTNQGTVQIDQVTVSTQTGLDLGGFRPDIYQTVKDLKPTSMRWPGGGYVAQYDWKWGIGSQEERQRWPHWMWLDYDQNAFGTDEFIQFCRQINTEPVIVVRVGFDRPESEHAQLLQDACDWVAYCNEPATGKWGSKRAANGHPEPYNVRLWEIDNEMWEMGIEAYEKAVRKFSVAMREVDPTIKIVACGGFREDEAFLNSSGSYFDYLSLHHYERATGYATGPERLGEQYNRYAEMIAKCPNPNIKLYISEWNLNSIDWRTGLFAGGFLNMCERTPVVEMGAAALFMRRTDAPDWNNAFINFDYKDLFVAPNYQVTKLWYDNFSKYRLAFTGNTDELNITTTLAENGSKVIVKVVNPTEKTYTLTIRGDWKGIADTDYTYYAPGSLDAINSMENKNAVALKNKKATASDRTVTLSVEPLSTGVLSIVKEF